MNEFRKKFMRWLNGDIDVMEDILDVSTEPELSRQSMKEQEKQRFRDLERRGYSRRAVKSQQRIFYIFYSVVAVISCIALIGVLLYTVSKLPRYGAENPRTVEVVRRYIEQGLAETGAVNVVAGMILDYRAFDTLGESHVLFTALICATILLQRDRKNMRTEYEDYFTIRRDAYFNIARDSIIRRVAAVILPCLFLLGIYILLNGQISPGGGFSGGAVLGAALIIFTVSFGFRRVDQFFNAMLIRGITFVSLTFYCFAKGYVFFTGANGLENHVPKGIPGAILSGGLILPLDIAVGFVVACTMFGFFSLFRRGSIGGVWKSTDK